MRKAMIPVAGTLGAIAGGATPWLIHRILTGGWQLNGYLMYIVVIWYIVSSCVGGTIGAYCGSMLGIRWAKSGGLVRAAGVIAASVGAGIAAATLVFFFPVLAVYLPKR
jgi:hypothetical protein